MMKIFINILFVIIIAMLISFVVTWLFFKEIYFMASFFGTWVMVIYLLQNRRKELNAKYFFQIKKFKFFY